jgi:ABC-type spermidine/putrescine transport system permease subunit II
LVAISNSADYLSGQMREIDDALNRAAGSLGAEIVDSWVEMIGE